MEQQSSAMNSEKSSLRKMKIFNRQTRNRITQFIKAKKGLSDKQIDDLEEDYEIPVEDIDPDNHELVDSHLRDSLIKSFMVIFTNEQSQHLLLNKDLIDIAFNCLEFAQECTIEAKRHVARLISIIFKFPQVQERLMALEVVKGICDLLQQTKHLSIIRYTLKACTYISMNYEFIRQSKFSLSILKQMMALLSLNSLDQRDDRYNIIITIKNILRGDKANKMLFLDKGGTQKFMEMILRSDDWQMVEMCVQGLSEQATYKKILVKLLDMP